MKLKKISLTMLIMLSGLTFGQNSLQAQKEIRMEFSERNILSYQQNSQNKIIEFYEYLSLYSTESDENLKKQIIQNIYSLTKNEINLVDITHHEFPTIKLNLFLQKIEYKNYQFIVKSPSSSEDIGLNEWGNYFEVELNGKSTQLTQQIIFEPTEKSFGDRTKTIWNLRLGDQFK
ncbi:MAG: hypothetical protein ACK5IC_00545 [Moheibacter sp.]